MSRIGRYSVVRKLATGGMAEVYLARIEGLADFRGRVVIKRILPHLTQVPGFVDLFLSEARLAGLLEHPNLVRVFDLGQESGAYHLVMEYVEGTSLRAMLQTAQAQREVLPIDRVAWILIQLLEGLSYAHTLIDDRGKPLQLVHRDVSPENVLLARSGAVKLADFGLVQAANHPAVAPPGAHNGKVAYLAPERVGSPTFDGRVDLFSAGVVLYEAVTNLKPFSGSTPEEVLEAVLHQPPTPLSLLRPGTPALLQHIVDRALAKDPRERYPTARAMQQDLEKLLDELRARPGPAHIAALVERARMTPSPISPFDPFPAKPNARPATPVGHSTVRSAPAFPDARLGEQQTLVGSIPQVPFNQFGQQVTLASKTQLGRPGPAPAPEEPNPTPAVPPRKR